MKNSLLSLLLISFSAASFANSCICNTNEATKSYQERSNTWYGMKVRFSCQYECRSPQGDVEQLEGFHNKRIVGNEKGNEIICDGTVYKEQYSPASNWFYWKYEGNKPFNPLKSDSLTLKQWAEANGCG